MNRRGVNGRQWMVAFEYLPCNKNGGKNGDWDAPVCHKATPKVNTVPC